MMKFSKIAIFIIPVFAILILTGCLNKTVSTGNKTDAEVKEVNNTTADEIQEANNATANEIQEVEADETAQNYSELFELNLYSDKTTYKTTDKIKIWATLKYIGDNSKIKIWHANPYISFSISDRKDFNTGDTFDDILTTTELEKGKLYRFEYSKSGGFAAEDPMAEFWKKFYSEKDLYLPEGEYTVKVSTAFSITENIAENKNSLSKEFKIVVK